VDEGPEKTPLGDWTARALDLALALFVSGAALCSASWR
jgi:hypothetical protein